MTFDILNELLFVDDIIQPDAHMFRTNQVHHILDVLDDQFTLRTAEKIPNAVDADHTTCFGAGNDLLV
jgi:hypothetical protein